MESIAIHQGKNTENVVKFVELSVDALCKYCSKQYAKRIIRNKDQGSLWGVYFTKTGRIRATFI